MPGQRGMQQPSPMGAPLGPAQQAIPYSVGCYPLYKRTDTGIKYLKKELDSHLLQSVKKCDAFMMDLLDSLEYDSKRQKAWTRVKTQILSKLIKMS